MEKDRNLENSSRATIARAQFLSSSGSLRNPCALSGGIQKISWTCHGLAVRYPFINDYTYLGDAFVQDNPALIYAIQFLIPHRRVLFMNDYGELLTGFMCGTVFQFLLSSSMDKTVRLWHISYDECLRVFSHNDYGKVPHPSFVWLNYLVSMCVCTKYSLVMNGLQNIFDTPDITLISCFKELIWGVNSAFKSILSSAVLRDCYALYEICTFARNRLVACFFLWIFWWHSVGLFCAEWQLLVLSSILLMTATFLVGHLMIECGSGAFPNTT